MGWIDRVVLSTVMLGIAAGGLLSWTGGNTAADFVWALITAAVLFPLSVTTARDLVRKKVAVDLIALLAMAGSLALAEYLAGAVIALMLSGGRALETYAATRASTDLNALLKRAPKVAHRHQGSSLVSIDVYEVNVGDRLLVKPGEVVPVDGTILAFAVLDESALTGEAHPVERGEGEWANSGVVNVGGPFDMTARTTAEQSTYQGIVNLVREAQASKGPFVRMADRYALIFLPVTIFVAGAAWVLTSNPVRALAVLVVATPCPLILAAPVAWVSGISRAARRGVIVKGSGSLEALGEAEILLMDKTGTLTEGTPAIVSIESYGIEASELLRVAASLDQVSHHPYATALTRESHERKLALSFPTEVSEQAGAGIAGLVDGLPARVGKADWVFADSIPDRLKRIRRRTAFEGKANVFVNVTGVGSGVLILEDPLRSDASRIIRLLKASGIRKVVLVTGDHPEIAEMVGNAVGVDLVLAERSPEEKVEAVRTEAVEGKTIMVGDGINDAPALATADVGVALGARGSASHSEAAGVVLTIDRLDRLAEAISIAQRSRQIAKQSVVAGMGLSGVAMLAAAWGLLVPVAGALVQEAIDVAVIINALRALMPHRGERRASEPEIGDHVRSQHRLLVPEVDRLRSVADRLDQLPAGSAFRELASLGEFLSKRLLPHEAEEESLFYPAVARAVGGSDPTSTMLRAHREIRHLVRLYVSLVEDLPEDGPSPSDIADIKRTLYGLHAILRLHFAQEDESYLSLEEFASAGSAGPTARSK